MDLDSIVLRLMAHGRTLPTRISVIEEDDPLRRGALCVRMGAGGTRVDIVRLRHESEGDGEVVKTVSRDGALETGKAEMDEMNRLTLRARALTGARHEIETPPSWSLCADLLGMSLIRGLGLKPYEMLNPVDAIWNKLPGRLERIIQHPRLGDASVIRRGGRCDLRMTIHTHAGRAGGPGTMWYSDASSDTPTLTISSRTALPETSMAAALGRPLSMIMAIPGVTPETMVETMACMPSDHGYDIVVGARPRQVPLLPAPQGQDTSWLQAS